MPNSKTLAAAAFAALLACGLNPALAHAAPVSGTTLYVDQSAADCSDAGPGSQSVPFCQIQAAADAVQPGQTVLIAPDVGAAPYAPFTVSTVGSANAGITFASAVPGVNVRVQGTGGQTTNDITVSNAQYATLSDFTTGAQGQSAISITGSSHIEIDHGSLSSFDMATGGPPPLDTVAVDGSSSDVTVSDDQFVSSSGWMLDVAAGARNIVVTDDFFNDDWQGMGGVRADGVTGIVVTADSFQTECGSAVDISGASSGSIENVVAVNAGRYPSPGTSAGGLSCNGYGPSAEIDVDATAAPAVQSDYNALLAGAYGLNYSWAGNSYSTSSAFAAATSQGAHDLILQNSFTIENNTEGSALIDSGNANAPDQPSTDINGNPRVDDPKVANTGTGDGYVDRGAFEFQNPLQLIWDAVSPDDGGTPLPVTATTTVNNPWNTQGVSYSTDFGDGTAASTLSAGLTASHTYTTPGRYTVTTTAQLPDGTTRSYTDSQPVQVNAPGPITTAFSDYSFPNDSSYVDLEVSSSSPWPITKTVINFGNGAPITTWYGPVNDSIQPYPDAGTHTVSYTVTDADGQTLSATDQFTTGLAFVPVKPYRVLDTRNGTGAPRAKVGPGKVVQVEVDGVDGIPSIGVRAVTMNVTATSPTAAGFVTAYAYGSPRPGTSNLNFTAGQTNPDLVTVPVSANGYVDLYNSAGSVDLIADLQGYFTDWPQTPSQPNPSFFQPINPTRVLDTGNGTGAPKKAVGPGTAVTVPLTPPANGWRPTAVELNLTDTGATANSWASAFPGTGPVPAVSNLNFSAGQTTSNLVVVPLPATGPETVRVFNNAGSVNLIADVQGYYYGGAVSSSTMLPFVPLTPVRAADTRSTQPLGAGGQLRVKVTGIEGIPVGAKAVLVNLTGTGASTNTFLTAFADGTPPSTSNVNLTPGETRPVLAVVQVDSSGYITIRNAIGTVNVIADLDGYYSN